MIGICGVGVLAYIVVGPVFPKAQLARVQIGMPRESVREILGEPTDVSNERDWQYSRTANAGWVQISFDNEGTVIQINDESAFP